MSRPVGWSAYQLRRSTTRRLLIVVFAAVLGLSVAVPVFAVGGGIEPQVVGGEPVPVGDLPFVSSLGDVRYGTTAYRRHFCGASLVDHNSVLTAAHCVKGTPKEPLRVTVGRTVLSGGAGQTRRVSRIVIHPRYSGVTDAKYDAAVLTLSNPVRGIAGIRLARAPVAWPRWPAGAIPSGSPLEATTGAITLIGCAWRTCR
jgi:secreted trypsin-like serine protease